MANRFFEGAAHAIAYAKFRPSPPTSLVQKIVTFVQEKVPVPLKCAVDVGCGSGQSTQVLAPFFSSVTGLDVSPAQVTQAVELNISPNVTFSVSGAEKLPFSDSNVQLITSGQACHWFDLPKFYKEVDRILVPGGVLALYGYLFPEPMHEGATENLFDIVDHVYSVETRSYWGSGRNDVDQAYSDSKFIIPYDSFVRDDSHYVDKMATVADLRGYISSWSGFQNFQSQNGDEAAAQLLNNFQNKVMSALPVTTSPEETEICLRYKYFLLMGRKPLKSDS